MNRYRFARNAAPAHLRKGRHRYHLAILGAMVALVAVPPIGGAASGGAVFKQGGSPVIPGAIVKNHGCGNVHELSLPAAKRYLQFRCLLNKTRAHRKLRPVTENAKLKRSAALKSGRLGKCKVFTHTPCGDHVAKQTHAVGHRTGMGENLLAANRKSSAWEVYEAWMRSGSHRENMLHPRWKSFGVHERNGVSLDRGRYRSVWVLHLG